MIYAISPVITSSFPTTLIFVKIERLPNRNPVFPQSPRLLLYKEKPSILTELRKVESKTKGKIRKEETYKSFSPLAS